MSRSTVFSVGCCFKKVNATFIFFRKKNLMASCVLKLFIVPLLRVVPRIRGSGRSFHGNEVEVSVRTMVGHRSRRRLAGARALPFVGRNRRIRCQSAVRNNRLPQKRLTLPVVFYCWPSFFASSLLALLARPECLYPGKYFQKVASVTSKFFLNFFNSKVKVYEVLTVKVYEWNSCDLLNRGSK